MNIYMMPLLGAGTDVDPIQPRYARTEEAPNDYLVQRLTEGFGFGVWPYGSEGVCIVGQNMDAARHVLLSALSDVIAVPPIDNFVGTSAPIVQSRLEAINIPAGWVNSSITYRQVLRQIGGFFFFVQRWSGLGGGKIFGSGVSLDTQFNQLPISARNRLVETAESFGWDTSSLGGITTLRNILKFMSDQWGAEPQILNNVEI